MVVNGEETVHGLMVQLESGVIKLKLQASDRCGAHVIHQDEPPRCRPGLLSYFHKLYMQLNKLFICQVACSQRRSVFIPN